MNTAQVLFHPVLLTNMDLTLVSASLSKVLNYRVPDPYPHASPLPQTNTEQALFLLASQVLLMNKERVLVPASLSKVLDYMVLDPYPKVL
jgi:hypothetical protein